MFSNYLKVALRNILRHRIYSFINIFGLALGMTCCFLMMMWVVDELSWDRFHAYASTLYRVEQDQPTPQGPFHVYLTPYAMGPALKDEIPEIRCAARTAYPGTLLVRAGDKVFYEDNAFSVDPSYLEMFSFPLIKGNAESVLRDPSSIVLTEELAEKYFGKEEPLGKTLLVNSRHPFAVTGVMRNLPPNSTLRGNILLPFAFEKTRGMDVENWRSNEIVTWVQLYDRQKAAAVDTSISELRRRHVLEQLRSTPGGTQNPRVSDVRFQLMPVTDLRLYARFGFGQSTGSIQSVSIFSMMALFILLIASINFMNLSTARSAARAKEVGIRKVMGALRTSLARQFYGESIFMTVVAAMVALMFVELLLPVFNALSGKNFTFYIGTFAMSRQLKYMRERSVGYDKEQLIYLPLRGETQSTYFSFKQALTGDPLILGVSATMQPPTFMSANGGGANWDGKDPNFRPLIGFGAVDYDYVETLKIPLVEGRSFSRDHPADSTSGVLVNESVVKLMGGGSVVGKRFTWGNSGSIIGVMKDYHYSRIQSAIEPLAVYLAPAQAGFAIVRLHAGNIEGSLDRTKAAWQKVNPDYPFEYRFFDEDFARMFQSDERMGTLFGYASIFAVVVACLGLFGLASFMAEQRTREIGVRKVLGASVAEITALLSKEFVKWVLIANLVAWPVAYLLLEKLMQNYAYRVPILWWLYPLAFLLSVGVALLTVSYQSVRAAQTNPVNALKYE